MTSIGGSIMLPEVRQAMVDAAPYFVDMQELNRKAGEIIGRYTGAEDGMVTAGCAAAMGLQMAACMTGKSLPKVCQLPDTEGMKDELIIPRNQRVVYDQAYKIPGAKFVEIGAGNSLFAEDYERAITEKTAAITYIYGPGLGRVVPLEDVVAIGHKHGVPVVVDAAAMLPPVENLTQYISKGADMVAFSGGKGVRGPQSTGILCGRKYLIEAARLHTCPGSIGILRVAKVCKEEIVGLIIALELFVNRDHEAVWNSWRKKAQTIANALHGILGIKVTVKEDREEFERQGPHAVISFGESWEGPSVEEIRRLLLSGDPPIYLYAVPDKKEIWAGSVELRDGEEEVVAEHLRLILKRG